MKNLLLVSVLFTLLSGTSLSASAQYKINSKNKNASGTGKMPVKFIEGIEIKRDMVPVFENKPPADITTMVPVIQANKTGDIEKISPLQFKYGQILNRNIESITNILLFSFIDQWWETPYQYGGTSKSGIDCSGFVGLLFSNVYATEIPRTAKEQYNACEKKEKEKLEEGDLVFFNTRGGVSHVGIYLGEGYFVHASTGNGITINNLDDDYYSARFLGGGRIVRAGDVVVKLGLQ